MSWKRKVGSDSAIWSDTEYWHIETGGSFSEVTTGGAPHLRMSVDSDRDGTRDGGQLNIEDDRVEMRSPDDAAYVRVRNGAVEISPAASAGDADTVDGFHAAGTPVTGHLLALDSNAKFPNSALYAGAGNGLDADKLDGQHGSYYATGSDVFTPTLDQVFDEGNVIDGAISGTPMIVGEGGTNGMLRVHGDGGDVWMDSSGSLMFRPNNDNDNCIKMSTVSNVPGMFAEGGDEIKTDDLTEPIELRILPDDGYTAGASNVYYVVTYGDMVAHGVASNNSGFWRSSFYLPNDWKEGTNITIVFLAYAGAAVSNLDSTVYLERLKDGEAVGWSIYNGAIDRLSPDAVGTTWTLMTITLVDDGVCDFVRGEQYAIAFSMDDNAGAQIIYTVGHVALYTRNRL